MKRLAGFSNRLVTLLSGGGAAIGAAFLLAMVVMITAGTLSRYLFDYPLAFVDEYSAYLFIAMGFLGLAYTFLAGGHVTIEVVVKRLRPRTKDILEVVTSLLTLFVVGILFWFGLKLAVQSFKIHSTAPTVMQTPLWLPQSSVWLGFLILILALLLHTVKKVRDFPKKDDYD